MVKFEYTKDGICWICKRNHSDLKGFGFDHNEENDTKMMLIELQYMEFKKPLYICIVCSALLYESFLTHFKDEIKAFSDGMEVELKSDYDYKE